MTDGSSHTPVRGTIVVTGASRGIGAAIALELARRGFLVVCLSRSGDLPGGSVELRQQLYPVACDITVESELAQAFKDASGLPGGLVGLVNSAGQYKAGRSEAFSLPDFEDLFRINAVALFAACRLAYPYLKAAGKGTIVNIGSVFERLGVANNACYCATKAAVGALTRALASEWARDNIAVIDLAPGYVKTGMNESYLERDDVKAYLRRQVPLGRATLPREIAGLTAMLFESDARILTGQTLFADGGHSMAHGNTR